MRKGIPGRDEQTHRKGRGEVCFWWGWSRVGGAIPRMVCSLQKHSTSAMVMEMNNHGGI